MNNKEIANQLRNLLHQVKLNQANCDIESLEINKLKMVIDHLDAAIDLLDIQEPWA